MRLGRQQFGHHHVMCTAEHLCSPDSQERKDDVVGSRQNHDQRERPQEVMTDCDKQQPVVKSESRWLSVPPSGSTSEGDVT